MDHLGLGLDVFRPRYFKPAVRFDPTSKEYDFFTFPSKKYKWNEEGRFDEAGHNINEMLQQWLFFGLLSTVLNDENFNQNLFHKDGSILTTQLELTLQEWEEREQNDERGRTMRMIRAQLALDKARETIQVLCSDDAKLEVDEYLALSLVVLGETLTNAKCKIVERFGFTIRGWHGDANDGWGIPSFVKERMIKEKGWCRRTIHVMSCQLKNHASTFLAAFKSYEDIEVSKYPFNALRGHEKCKEDRCVFRSTKQGGEEYMTRHHQDCMSSDPKCPMIGPDNTKLAEVINNGKIPVLVYEEKTSSVHVMEYKPYQTYAAISHVWADGYGNRTTNQLPKCQLDYFYRLIKNCPLNDEAQARPLFWIDTLANPPHSYKDERRKSVQNIRDVYNNAKFTIVLDLALMHVSSGLGSYSKYATRILASGWMRRLWTLQEAYMSKKIMFAFNNEELKNLDDIEELYPEAKHSLVSNISTAARTYFHHMMGPERLARIHNFQPHNRYDIIVSVWRSAQWRTINYQAHEVLALATLLEIDYEEKKSINEASVKAEPLNRWDRQKKTPAELEQSMADLWALLDENSPGSIPSGIIFLPGNRLSLRGFGWAPNTWMSGESIDYPDPLEVAKMGARLVHHKGLNVHFSGFVLHARHTRTIFWPRTGEAVHFPSDSTLLEWYQIEKADNAAEKFKGKLLEKVRQFAVILCRPKPRETNEIALLVDITKTISRRMPGSPKERKVFEAYIICRVWIKRQIDFDRSHKWRELIHRNDNESDFICGEELDTDQEWYIDGYTDPPVEQSQVSIAATAQSPASSPQESPVPIRSLPSRFSRVSSGRPGNSSSLGNGHGARDGGQGPAGQRADRGGNGRRQAPRNLARSQTDLGRGGQGRIGPSG
ncbi:hypothetical protein BDV96DRAFT_608286 [Lophiotrema nucula]|uniref:Heterokaryon incompatibility domain-containing protein n=1 Tax=Lophiotrema nucula TaxID=690887 RepID=A0A6A5YGW0_9PLEO|nr:hypothetical protein BDV96DRAFT_608286 [Lophiotrema nucula]